MASRPALLNGTMMTTTEFAGAIAQKRKGVNAMEDRLTDFLQRYVGRGEAKKDKVSQDDVEILVHAAVCDGIEQEIINYGTENPDAPFWDFLAMLKPGYCDGVTQEELLTDDD